MGTQQSRNSKGKPAKTHHANRTMNWKCGLKLRYYGHSSTFKAMERNVCVTFSNRGTWSSGASPEPFAPQKERCVSTVMMNRVTADENMTNISILLVKSYNDLYHPFLHWSAWEEKNQHLFLWSWELAEILQRVAELSYKLFQQKMNKFLHKCWCRVIQERQALQLEPASSARQTGTLTQWKEKNCQGFWEHSPSFISERKAEILRGIARKPTCIN